MPSRTSVYTGKSRCRRNTLAKSSLSKHCSRTTPTMATILTTTFFRLLSAKSVSGLRTTVTIRIHTLWVCYCRWASNPCLSRQLRRRVIRGRFPSNTFKGRKNDRLAAALPGNHPVYCEPVIVVARSSGQYRLRLERHHESRLVGIGRIDDANESSQTCFLRSQAENRVAGSYPSPSLAKSDLAC